MSKLQLAILFFLVALAFLFRVYNLTASPAALYIDETSIGYNAWSILTTGKEEHGTPMPLFFEAFGEYKLPVYIYSVVVSQFFLGSTDAAVRLPAVLYGVGTVLGLFFLVKEIVESRKKEQWAKVAPFMVAGLLAISPWHFQFTHAGFEASSALFFLVVGVWLWLRAVRTKTVWLLVAAIISFVLTLYSYNSARIVTPILVIALFVFTIRKVPFWYWLAGGVVGAVCIIPFLQFAFSPSGLARAQQVSILYQNKGPVLPIFVKNYLANISFETVFVKGEPTIAHETPHRWGLLYLVEAPFVLIGFLVLGLKRSRYMLFMLIWLLVGFIPPAVTTLNPHALRAFLVIPALLFLSGIGVSWVVETVGRMRRVQVGILMVYAVVLAISAVRFLHIYHTQYTFDAGWDWQVDIKQGALAAKARASQYDYIFFKDVGPAKISLLWYVKIPPADFLAANKNHGNNWVVGKYHFTLDSVDEIPATARVLFVTKNRPPETRKQEVIYYPNGSEAFWLWE